jgi:hypothetical protein
MSEYLNVFKRMEIKYLLSDEQYSSLLEFLEKSFRIDEYGKTQINNIYFDTPDYRMIRKSLEKPLYKEKLRLRTYGDTENASNSFIEIKKKYDGIVYKRRISGRYEDTYNYLVNGGNMTEQSQISREIEELRRSYDNLRPAMAICYDRIAMIGKNNPQQRITFDTNIRWDTRLMDLRNIKNGNPILKDGQHLMEIKVLNAMPMELSSRLSELGIFPASFSKYGKGYIDMISRKKKQYLMKTNSEVMPEKGVVIYA